MQLAPSRRSTVKALIPSRVMNATTFLKWFGNFTPNKLLQAHPEHYVEIESVNNGVTSVDIVEEWGNLLTHYTIPNYGPGTKVDKCSSHFNVVEKPS